MKHHSNRRIRRAIADQSMVRLVWWSLEHYRRYGDWTMAALSRMRAHWLAREEDHK